MTRSERTPLFVSLNSFTINYDSASSSIVYDSVELSPHYDGTINDLYIDERELIELPSVSQAGEGTINEPY